MLALVYIAGLFGLFRVVVFAGTLALLLAISAGVVGIRQTSEKCANPEGKGEWSEKDAENLPVNERVEVPVPPLQAQAVVAADAVAALSSDTHIRLVLVGSAMVHVAARYDATFVAIIVGGLLVVSVGVRWTGIFRRLIFICGKTSMIFANFCRK